jgi:hypothetical protein
MASDIKHFFIYVPIGHIYAFFWEMSIQVSCPFLMGDLLSCY